MYVHAYAIYCASKSGHVALVCTHPRTLSSLGVRGCVKSLKCMYDIHVKSYQNATYSWHERTAHQCAYSSCGTRLVYIATACMRIHLYMRAKYLSKYSKSPKGGKSSSNFTLCGALFFVFSNRSSARWRHHDARMMS
jgi:hypothetical protein